MKGFMSTQGETDSGITRHFFTSESKWLMGHGPPNLVSLLSRRHLPVFAVGLCPIQ